MGGLANNLGWVQLKQVEWTQSSNPYSLAYNLLQIKSLFYRKICVLKKPKSGGNNGETLIIKI